MTHFTFIYFLFQKDRSISSARCYGGHKNGIGRAPEGMTSMKYLANEAGGFGGIAG